MASGRTDTAECFLQYTARGANVTDVAYGDDVIRIVHSAHARPLDPVEAYAELGHLWDQIIAFNPTKIHERHLVDDSAILQRGAQRIKSSGRQLGSLDPTHQILVCKRIQIRKC